MIKNLVLLLFVLVLTAHPLHADMLRLSDSQGGTLTLTLPHPLIVADSSDGDFFTTLADSDEFGPVFLGFGSTAYPFDLEALGLFGQLLFNGDALYSGNESAPTLLYGDFQLTTWQGDAYSLSITSESPTAVTPESSTLSLLCLGLTGILCICLISERKRVKIVS
jgi:hypothetical protein